jgi:hypothetical protein
MKPWFALLALIGIQACNTPPPTGEDPAALHSALTSADDDDGGDDAEEGKTHLHSCCGFPGDHGNELGVGKFCKTDKQCRKNSAAKLCSAFENDKADHKTFFCTMPCDPSSPVNVCGAGATCNCEELGCGCTPIACINNPPEGCKGP